MLKHFKESKKEIKEHWPNAKFVIFEGSKDLTEKKFLERMRKEEEFNIIFHEEISDVDFENIKYQLSKSDTHPNEKAWDTIVPLLVKKLGIK